jgi:multidrug resistance efflux pump
VGLGVAVVALSLVAANGDVSPPSAAESPATADGPAKPFSRAVSFGYVDVELGITSLYPLQPGRVKRVLVKENDSVEAGAPLFEMDDTLAKAQLEEAKADLGAAEVELKLARSLPAQHKARVDAQQAAVAAKEHELDAAKAKSAQAARLAERTLGSKEDARVAADTVEALAVGVTAERAKLQGLKAIHPSGGIERAEQQVAAKKAQLGKAEYAVREMTIRAPAKGEVLRVLVTVGETLGPNPRQPAIQFAAAGPRIIRAEVEQEFANRVGLNQTAYIHDDSSSDRIWTGKVTRISDWYTHRRSQLQEPLQFNDVRTLECLITLDPKAPPLRIGQRVRVMLERDG